MILYNHNKHIFGNSEKDIEILGRAAGIIKVENIFRCMQSPSTESSNLYGIRATNDSFMKNQASNSISSNNITASGVNTQGLLNNYISYQIIEYPNIIDTTYIGSSSNSNDNSLVYPNNSFPQGTYIYSASIILDKDRNIGYDKYTIEKSVSVPINSNFVRLSFIGDDYYVGMYIRLFRRTVSSGKIDYLDIPVCSSYAMYYDIGISSTLFGEQWTTITNDVNRYRPQNCTNYQFFGNNVKVNLDAYPTKGKWKKGDIINYSSLSVILTTDLNL
jgi:hypothetical protein